MLYILWLFGGLLYLQSTLACDEDRDCPYAGERCCKSTETGKELAKGICMMRTCGGDVCRTQYDCLPNKRCDASIPANFHALGVSLTPAG